MSGREGGRASGREGRTGREGREGRTQPRWRAVAGVCHPRGLLHASKNGAGNDGRKVRTRRARGRGEGRRGREGRGREREGKGARVRGPAAGSFRSGAIVEPRGAPCEPRGALSAPPRHGGACAGARLRRVGLERQGGTVDHCVGLWEGRSLENGPKSRLDRWHACTFGPSPASSPGLVPTLIIKKYKHGRICTHTQS